MTAQQPHFSTGISGVASGSVFVRGVDIKTLIHEASVTDVFGLVLTGRRPTEPEAEMMRAIFAAAADHGFVSTCASVVRYAASGSGTMPAAVAAGILSLGSGTAVPHLVARLLLELAPGGETVEVSDAAIDDVLSRYIQEHRRVPGLGHPVHTSGDPRTTALREEAHAHGCYAGYVAMMDRVEQRFAAVRGRALPQNVDGIIAAILLHFHWTPDQIFGLTVLALAPGLIAHASEEIDQGHVMRMIAPADADYEPENVGGGR